MIIERKMNATGDPRLQEPLLTALWERFCFGKSTLTVQNGAENTFVLGEEPLPVLRAGKEYAFSVSENGAAVVGADYNGLVRGYFALLMQISPREEVLFAAPVAAESNYRIKNRMLHLCIFPETDYYFAKKLVRLAGLCQYTHLVIEFWGTLQYDCLKELSWPQAWSKEQAASLIHEVRVMGMEPIPMFNQLGHATACRLINGKHVVLDQNPALQELFTPDGWAWDIHSPKVRALLKAVRKELYELFGEGEYMHIGCDEAYYYTRCDEERKKLPDYLRQLTAEVVEEGRRPMVWMDMFLERDKYNHTYKAYATCAPDEVEQMQAALHPETVPVDWQYRMEDAPLETMMSLKPRFKDVVGAPWYNPKNYTAIANTVAEEGFFGIMMTTWHTLNPELPSVLGCAKECGAAGFPWSPFSGLREETATLLRRVSIEGNAYQDCGWSPKQF